MRSLAAFLPLCAVVLAQPALAQSLPGANPDGRIRAQIAAVQQTTLSAELSAKIASLPLKEGEGFRAGDIVASFDCSLFRAQLDKAEASAEAARQTLKVHRRLAELGSISNLEVEQSQAKARETEAEAAAMRVTVGKCDIAAPFSGRVAKMHAEPYQYVQQGKPLMEIVDSQRLEVKLLVPSRWLAWLARGSRFSILVDDLNRSYAARVTRLGARIDPINQTVMVAGEVQGKHGELLSGMSGWASFRPPR